ncbi:MAG: tRNA (adenosine(37)-N6)-threonylcarbamoyltransferase complex ATPase subunit type 1 TsaE [Candidatus Omnitrophica bacterium CG07_land_8_20_14_0_80_42_15]|uniref:tRNA threonylcarbamoyladenosine biosynthesis protein TsaE n=1 Tax=Candidatus Aquitaenariimonas noxiae TaxID=1974741 RepID=A0A2J0KUN1_9BACT|nr:MAG: tRNA (adenosine(37)-N6)-threonylcarbamoyltransferase complex ATPase subunit type 1 TsaE [Candidatus Omnitrophica bacterium CG07_land_8_20_14_0_80_42_15]
MKAFISKSPSETEKLGKKIASFLTKGDVLALIGELGSGKTTFTKGIAEGLGVKTAKYVNSPSFVIIKEHAGRIPLFHMDLYRLEDISELDTTGYEEYVGSDGICVIEWADKMSYLLPKEHIRIEMYFKDVNERLIKLIPKGARYKELLGKIK